MTCPRSARRDDPRAEDEPGDTKCVPVVSGGVAISASLFFPVKLTQQRGGCAASPAVRDVRFASFWLAGSSLLDPVYRDGVATGGP